MTTRPQPPRHRRARHRAPTAASRARARVSAALPTVRTVGGVGRPALAAVAVTGIVVGGAGGSSALSGAGSVAEPDSGTVTGATDVAGSSIGSSLASALGERVLTSDASRSGGRTEVPEVSLDRMGAEPGVSGEGTVEAPSDPRDIARAMLVPYGWSAEFGCLDQLYIGESNWDHTATNPTSGAYGIPQSLPAEKMATAGSDWRTNPATQIEWGLSYIEDAYGSPCAANSFKLANGWY